MNEACAALLIQRWVRRFLAITRCAGMRARHARDCAMQHRVAAAVAIQAAVRGCLTRKALVRAAAAAKIARWWATLVATQIERLKLGRMKQQRQDHDQMVLREESCVQIQSLWLQLHLPFLHSRLLQLRDARIEATEQNEVKQEEQRAALMLECAYRVHAARRRLVSVRLATQIGKDCTTAAICATEESRYAASMIKRAWRVHYVVSQKRNQKEKAVQEAERLAVSQERNAQSCFALRIQQLYRNVVATRRVARLREHEKDLRQFIREKEAAAVLSRFCRLCWAMHCVEHNIKLRTLQNYVLVATDAATLIQSVFRMHCAKKTAQLLREQRRIDSAVTIQSSYRRHLAAILVDRMMYDRINEEILAALSESATLIQARWRGHHARQRAAYLRQCANLSKAAARVGRAFLCRCQIFEMQRRMNAVVVMQRSARIFLARCQANAQRSLREKAFRQLRRDQSALVIQRNWRIVEATKELRALKLNAHQRNEAARRMQRCARVYLSRLAFAECTAAKQYELLSLQAEQAALLIQCLVRGHLARLHVMQTRRHEQEARQQIARCWLSYLSRLALHQELVIHKSRLAAAVIQLGWKRHMSHRLANEKLLERRAYALRLRQKEKACSRIQAHFRGFFQRQAFRKLQERRSAAAMRIQCRIRSFQAKKMLANLRLVAVTSRCARKIQLLWLQNKSQIQQQSEARRLEAKLVQLAQSSFEHTQSTLRWGIAHEEDSEFKNALTSFHMALEEMYAKQAARLEAWEARAPPTLREHAALRIQSIFRGFEGKCTATGLRAMRNSQLLPLRTCASHVQRMDESGEDSSASLPSARSKHLPFVLGKLAGPSSRVAWPVL